MVWTSHKDNERCKKKNEEKTYGRHNEIRRNSGTKECDWRKEEHVEETKTGQVVALKDWRSTEGAQQASSHRVAQVSLVRVISWSSHDERHSSTLSSPFHPTSSSSHSSFNLLQSLLPFLEDSSNTAYSAKKEIGSTDEFLPLHRL